MIKRLTIAVSVATSLAFASAGAAQTVAPSDLTVPVSLQAKPYIVLMAGDPVLTYEGDISGYSATKPGKGKKINPNSSQVRKYQNFLNDQHNEAVAQVGADLTYSYSITLNGFAARMTEAQVAELKRRGDVLAVYEDELLKPHTNSTPAFLNLTEGSDSWSKGFVGEDVIIASIDSGIQGDHPSVADVPTPMKGNKGPLIPYDAPPASWSGTGCDLGGVAPCTNKLLKAEAFSASFQANSGGAAAGELFTAQDTDGHGTHTATTAGGNWGVPASVNGVDFGTVSGIAPRARIATYKVCFDAANPDNSGCYTSDTMAGVDQAVADGADVINYSIGGSSNNFASATNVAFLIAADAGVWVATSAGNAGPNRGTVGTPSGVPWITAVAATEDDENFGTALEVQSPESLAQPYEGLEGNGPVQLSDTGDIVAEVENASPLDGCTPLANDLTGKIALVVRGVCAFSTKYNMAAAAGADAIVVFNDGAGLDDRVFPIVMSAPGTTIPGIMISSFDGAALSAELDGGETIVGRLSPDILISRVDRVAIFSSRGQNNGDLNIIKPDVAAPGVAILAGETLIPNASAGGGQLFSFLQGTSMASPHVAGAFAILKQAHPDFSAAQARSALMTTARQDLQKSFGDALADPFDMGAGLVQPNEAVDPGLTYDAGILDYLAFMCVSANQQPLTSQATCDALAAAGFLTDTSDLNLPSIGVGSLVGQKTVTRTVTAATTHSGFETYHVQVDAPAGIDVAVSPSTLKLKNGQSASYEVTFTALPGADLGEWTFGSLTWSSANTDVYSPIAVKPEQIDTPAEVDATGDTGTIEVPVRFGYTGDYTATVSGLTASQAIAQTISEADGLHAFCGALPAMEQLRFATFDADTTTPGQDDIDLRLFTTTNCATFDGLALVGASGGATSEEVIDIANAPANNYLFVIDYFAAAVPGDDIDYVANIYVVTGDEGNTSVTAPASAVTGATDTVLVDYTVAPGARYLGVLSHQDGGGEIARTILDVDAQ